MDQTSFLLAKIDLDIICQRVQNSLDEIKEKNPNRHEYIGPMTKSIEQLTKVRLFLEQIELELNTSRQRNVDLELINLLRLKEIEELKNQIKFNNLEL